MFEFHPIGRFEFHPEIKAVLITEAATNPNKPLGINSQREPINGLLRMARIERGLLQSDVADSIGVSTSLVGFAESLRIFPSPEKRKAIATVLLTPTETMFPPWLQTVTTGINPDSSPSEEIPGSYLDREEQDELTKRETLTEEREYTAGIDEIAGMIDTINIVSRILNGQTPRNKELFRAHMAGYTDVEIAEKIGITHERVRQLHKSIEDEIKTRIAIHQRRDALLAPSFPNNGQPDQVTQSTITFLTKNIGIVLRAELAIDEGSHDEQENHYNYLVEQVRNIIRFDETFEYTGQLRLFASKAPLYQLIDPEAIIKKFFLKHPTANVQYYQENYIDAARVAMAKAYAAYQEIKYLHPKRQDSQMEVCSEFKEDWLAPLNNLRKIS